MSHLNTDVLLFDANINPPLSILLYLFTTVIGMILQFDITVFGL